MGEGDSSFGHAKKLKGLLGRDGDLEGRGISEADVFGGGDDESTGNKAGVFSGVEHFREPVKGGIRIGSPDGFDEGRDGVVVLVAIGVVEDGFLLDRLSCDGEIENDGAIDGWGGEDGEFKSGERLAGISVGLLGKMLKGLGMSLDGHLSEAAFLVVDGSMQQGDEVRGRNGFELKDLGAGDERGVDVKVGIVGSGSDEAHGAALQVGEEGVLLGFVEAVDLVDKQDGGLIAEGLVRAGRFDLSPDFSDVGFDAIK